MIDKLKSYMSKKETKDTIKFIGILAVIYIVISIMFTYIPFLNTYQSFAIQTGSMEPIINTGDIVVTKYISPEDVEVGDIIAFYVDITNDDKDDVVVHYIAEVMEDDGVYTFKTKPHISPDQDRWTIEAHDLIGEYQFKVGAIGNVILFLQSWTGRLILLIDIIIISIIYDIIFKNNKKTKITDQDSKVPELEESTNTLNEE